MQHVQFSSPPLHFFAFSATIAKQQGILELTYDEHLFECILCEKTGRICCHFATEIAGQIEVDVPHDHLVFVRTVFL